MTSQDPISLTRDLLRFDTINPPGRERDCARYAGAMLQEWGFDVQFFEYAEGRTSLVARAGGSDRKAPLCLTGHLDVVPLGARAWTKDPFNGDTDAFVTELDADGTLTYSSPVGGSGIALGKAIALGAKAVAIGKLQAWGLAAGGKDGVVRVLEILESEMLSTMGLLGAPTLVDLTARHVIEADPVTPPHEMSAWVNLPGGRLL